VIQQTVRVESNQQIADGLFLMRFDSAQIAAEARPGQFLNIRAEEGWGALLLRRPFSISRIDASSIELVYAIVGRGTKILAGQRPGDRIDVLGPLGVPFRYNEPFDTALVVAGGLGVAPFPFLTDYLAQLGKSIITFVGSRTEFRIDSLHLQRIVYATDDGSRGFKGTVVDCLKDYLNRQMPPNPKIFGCGPTRMLSSLSTFARDRALVCELSLEGDMGCGFGICQGCPVEKNAGEKKYALVCKDGPTFDSRDIILPTP